MSRYGSNLTPAAPSSGSRFGTKGRGSRGRREPSGVFTLFQPAQVQQFREAFSLIDQDGDGTVSEEDLKRIFASLGERLCFPRTSRCRCSCVLILIHNLIHVGITPSNDKLRDLLSSRPGGAVDHSGEGVNFMEFLTMMGEHLFEFDGEAELIEAFESFDESDTGFVKVEEMRRWLSEVGERMQPDEVCLAPCTFDNIVIPDLSSYQIDRFLKGPFTDRQGNFNYREWVKVLRINADDEQQQ
jgi:myosin regulatory light chain 12